MIIMKITTEGSVHSIFQTSEQRPIEFEAVNNKKQSVHSHWILWKQGGGVWGQALC